MSNDKSRTMKGRDGWIDKNIYRKFMCSMPICTVDVLFFDSAKKKVLLCKRRNEPLKGGFFSVGGRLLKNEAFIDGAIRQVERELGLKLDSDKLVFGGIANEVFDNSIYDGIGYHAVNIYWGYRLKEGELLDLVLDDQHTEYSWFDVDFDGLHPYIEKKVYNLIPKL